MPKLNRPPRSLTHIKMATVLQGGEMDEKKSSGEREPWRLRLPPLRPGSRTASATSTAPPARRGGLAFSSGREWETGSSSSPEAEGPKRCLLFACSFVEELGRVIEDSASPRPSNMGYAPPLRMWSSIFCLPMARSLALPGLAWDVQCNLKTLLYLDLISNMTAHPTPTLCSQGNSSRLQEKGGKKKRERREEGPIPQPSKPLS